MQKKNLKIAAIVLPLHMANTEEIVEIPEGAEILRNCKVPYVNKMGQLALSNIVRDAAERYNIPADRFRTTKVDKVDNIFDLRVAVLCPAQQSSLPTRLSANYQVNDNGEITAVPTYAANEDGTPSAGQLAFDGIVQAVREYIAEQEAALAIPANVVELTEGSTVILKGDKKQVLETAQAAVKVKENTKTWSVVLTPSLQDAIILSKQLEENPEASAEMETVRIAKD